ncbi:hypothetical protein Amir_1893 [Actinosynnema mirum DSM 43827]|uniref:DUF4383 domain-containing protein n=1 Tax=Actinosynnema mirum (strain ATCC 29888 / DSM 43827 / JCM 3225 / NBRC 14064 / NCIMB 13271 / NRRL B-12336 / IMRU 3971 / 101) TaxID=446462 RepID=C6WE98_ACTMD|nr:hypothetical protein Amir_1893 [Actinosynnema mirum DSM 43827]
MPEEDGSHEDGRREGGRRAGGARAGTGTSRARREERAGVVPPQDVDVPRQHREGPDGARASADAAEAGAIGSSTIGAETGAGTTEAGANAAGADTIGAGTTGTSASHANAGRPDHPTITGAARTGSPASTGASGPPPARADTLRARAARARAKAQVGPGKRPGLGGRGPGQAVALGVGAVFLLVGVLGFIPGITTGYSELAFAGAHSTAMLLGVFQVSVLHNAVHLLFGAAGVAAAANRGASRAYLVVGGGAYLVLWLFGSAVHEASAANFVPFNAADNLLHLALGLGMAALGIATTAVERARGVYPGPEQFGEGQAGEQPHR